MFGLRLFSGSTVGDLDQKCDQNILQSQYSPDLQEFFLQQDNDPKQEEQNQTVEPTVIQLVSDELAESDQHV